MTEVFDCTDPAQRATGIASAISALKGGASSCCPPTPSTASAPTRSTARPSPRCWRRRAAAATCRSRCWSGRGTPSTGLVYSVPHSARELIRAFWPGALSLVVRQAPSLQWDLGDAHGTVMLRMPLHPVAIELLREVGPMAVSSANISGRPAAVTADDARDQLGELVEVYLDGGPVRTAGGVDDRRPHRRPSAGAAARAGDGGGGRESARRGARDAHGVSHSVVQYGSSVVYLRQTSLLALVRSRRGRAAA